MDRLTKITAFVKVAETGSFSAAARALGVSTTVVSKHVRELEEWLGVRLFNRTTRHVALTEVGAAFQQRCTELVGQFDELETAAGRWRAEPRGVLRVSAPLVFGAGPIAAQLPHFLAQYPQVSVELTLTDRYVDVLEEEIDVAIAMGELPSSSAMARPLTRLQGLVCASPAYLAAHGTPAIPADLLPHNCLLHTTGPFARSWEFKCPDGAARQVKVVGNLRTNSAVAHLTAALAGHGIAVLPDYLVEEPLAQGRLVALLADYAAPEIPVRMVYAPGSYMASKLQVFLDFLALSFASTR
jgi:DNA-binding transcriptional LysR family regulator